MKLSKIFKYAGKDAKIDEIIRGIDADLIQLYNFTKGQVRLGSCIDGERGENIAGEFQVFASSATADAEFTVTHTLGVAPLGYIILNQDKAGSLYAGANTHNTTTAYFKCDVATVTFTTFLLK